MPGIDYEGVAELYDLYVTADYDLPFFVDEARRSRGPVVELTSGTGRVSIPLAEAGADLTCVDMSRAMLSVLERKLAARGLAAEIVCADVCRLTLERRFDLALWPFQAFMEIVAEADQAAALASVFALLNAGGRLICTMHNPAVRRASVDGVFRVAGRFPAEGGTLVVSGVETGGRPVVTRLQFLEFFDEAGALLWKRVQAMEFTMVEREAFEGLARAAGFRVARLFGDYGRGPFDPTSSPVMIWELERPAPGEGPGGESGGSRGV